MSQGFDKLNPCHYEHAGYGRCVLGKHDHPTHLFSPPGRTIVWDEEQGRMTWSEGAIHLVPMKEQE
jgi:hypothetical protein